MISDSYGSHDCQASDEFATLLNIDMITVPKGLTAKYQPLDLKLNGNIKSQQKKFMNCKATKEIMDFFDVHKGQFDGEIPLLNNISKQEAAEVLSIIRDHINPSNIIEAFDQSICSYFDDINEDDNYNEDIEFEKKLNETLNKYSYIQRMTQLNPLQRYQFQLLNQSYPNPLQLSQNQTTDQAPIQQICFMQQPPTDLSLQPISQVPIQQTQINHQQFNSNSPQENQENF